MSRRLFKSDMDCCAFASDLGRNERDVEEYLSWNEEMDHGAEYMEDVEPRKVEYEDDGRSRSFSISIGQDGQTKL